MLDQWAAGVMPVRRYPVKHSTAGAGRSAWAGGALPRVVDCSVAGVVARKPLSGTVLGLSPWVVLPVAALLGLWAGPRDVLG